MFIITWTLFAFASYYLTFYYAYHKSSLCFYSTLIVYSTQTFSYLLTALINPGIASAIEYPTQE
jgi:hypothetical protein